MERVLEQLPKGSKKVVAGIVVSHKMDKTIVVAVERRRTHKLYKKYVTVTKKLKAHDEDNLAKAGDAVRLIESRRVSKDKAWRLLEIVERAR